MILALVGLSSCATAPDESSKRVLAEVGNDVLTVKDVRDAIPYVVWQADSVNASAEYVKRWTMTRLLTMEAEKLGLHELDDVARRIRSHRDDVLIETLRDRALASMDNEIRVSDSEIETYFEEHKAQFAFTERHVRIRHLSANSLDFALAAKAELDRGLEWEGIVERYAADKPSALASPDVLRPVSSLLSLSPTLQASMSDMRVNQISSIREYEGRFHFAQLLESYPAGSIPDISWVKDRILEWLTIEKRRLALLSFEQNLLLKAQADGTVRNPDSP
jgi:hypothetical protein